MSQGLAKLRKQHVEDGEGGEREAGRGEAQTGKGESARE